MEKIVNIFQPTLNIISFLEGQKYITESVILLQLCQLEKSIDSMKEFCMFKILLSLNSSLSITFVIISDSNMIDPEASNRELHTIMNDFKDEINSLWDRLPLDTVIASVLDPRTKFFGKIPIGEINGKSVV